MIRRRPTRSYLSAPCEGSTTSSETLRPIDKGCLDVLTRSEMRQTIVLVGGDGGYVSRAVSAATLSYFGAVWPLPWFS